MPVSKGRVVTAQRRPVRTVTVRFDPPVGDVTFADVDLEDFNDLLAACAGRADVTIDFNAGGSPPPPAPSINSVRVHG